MTKAYEDRLIEIKNKLLDSITKNNKVAIDMWTTHLIGYIDALEDLRKEKV